MSRLARVVAVDCPHHVNQRGNYRQQTFFCDEDYRLYLELLNDYSRQYSLELWGKTHPSPTTCHPQKNEIPWTSALT